MPTLSLASGLFISQPDGSWTGDPIAALEPIAAAGFRQSELMAEGPQWLSATAPDTTKMRQALDRLGIYPHTIHTPMTGVNLASRNEQARRNAVNRIADSMRYLGALGGRTAIVHPSGIPTDGEEPNALENLGTSMDIVHRSVGELVRTAEQTGVRIALENLPDRFQTPRPLIHMRELRALIAGFPPDHVGLCLDTGHACISGLDPAEQARIASERLYALHIQDVDGQNDCHWVPGQGVINWSDLGAALSDIGFDGAWTMEALCVKTDLTPQQVVQECAQVRQRWEDQGMSN